MVLVLVVEQLVYIELLERQRDKQAWSGKRLTRLPYTDMALICTCFFFKKNHHFITQVA